MAKAEPGIASAYLRGSIGDVTYRLVRGRQIVSSKPIPPTHNTAPALFIKELFRRGMASWTNITETTRSQILSTRHSPEETATGSWVGAFLRWEGLEHDQLTFNLIPLPNERPEIVNLHRPGDRLFAVNYIIQGFHGPTSIEIYIVNSGGTLQFLQTRATNPPFDVEFNTPSGQPEPREFVFWGFHTQGGERIRPIATIFPAEEE